jgi:predicted GNAT family N-acyltransferase
LIITNRENSAVILTDAWIDLVILTEAQNLCLWFYQEHGFHRRGNVFDRPGLQSGQTSGAEEAAEKVFPD